MRRFLPALVTPLCLAALLGLPAVAAAKVTIKFSSAVPENAPGMDILKDAAAQIEKETDGEVRVKLYLGVDGDEKDIVRKMRVNQRHAAHLTGVGLAEVLPEIHVLDLPFFFETYDEVDAVYADVLPHFQTAFRTRDFEFLGFAETGFVYLYSKQKVSTLDDLRQASVWAWEGDPLTLDFVKEGEMKAVPLALPDVLTSLSTGLIDTVYGPPLAMIALQWFTKVTYFQSVPFVHATGGVIMNDKTFSKLSPEQAAIVRRIFLETSAKMTAELRTINEDSKQTLTDEGIETLPVPSEEQQAGFRELAEKVNAMQVGKLFSQELLDRVKGKRDEVRAGGGAAPAAEPESETEAPAEAAAE